MFLNSRIHLTEQASTDINGIWEYTRVQWSMNQANKYVGMIYSVCEMIDSNPLLFGRDDHCLGTGIRSYRAGRHRIFYRLVESGIVVLRVLHGSMRFTREMFEEQ